METRGFFFAKSYIPIPSPETLAATVPPPLSSRSPRRCIALSPLLAHDASSSQRRLLVRAGGCALLVGAAAGGAHARGHLPPDNLRLLRAPLPPRPLQGIRAPASPSACALTVGIVLATPPPTPLEGEPVGAGCGSHDFLVVGSSGSSMSPPAVVPHR